MVLLIVSHCHVRHSSTVHHQGVVAERSKALIHWSWSGFESRWRHFHFECFNPSLIWTVQWIPCKWNQAWPFTCSNSCFRPMIRLIIQGFVYLWPQYSFKRDFYWGEYTILNRIYLQFIYWRACAQILETRFQELAVSLLDFSPSALSQFCLHVTIWTKCAFRVMHPHQWSLSKQSGFKSWKRWPESALTSLGQTSCSNKPRK